MLHGMLAQHPQAHALFLKHPQEQPNVTEHFPWLIHAHCQLSTSHSAEQSFLIDKDKSDPQEF